MAHEVRASEESRAAAAVSTSEDRARARTEPVRAGSRSAGASSMALGSAERAERAPQAARPAPGPARRLRNGGAGYEAAETARARAAMEPVPSAAPANAAHGAAPRPPQAAVAHGGQAAPAAGIPQAPGRSALAMAGAAALGALGESDELEGAGRLGEATSAAGRARGAAARLAARRASATTAARAAGAPPSGAPGALPLAARAEGARAAGTAARGRVAVAKAAGSGGAGAAAGAAVPVLLVAAALLALVLLASAIAGGDEDSVAGLSADEAQVASLLKAAGLDEVHVAAVMGNWACESQCNPRQVQHGFGYCRDADGNGVEDCSEQADYPPELVGNPSCGYGLAQWTYPTRSLALVRYAEALHAHSGEAAVQVGFFMEEFGPSRAAFEAIDSVEGATRWFHDVYERSADGPEGIAERVSEAQRIYAALTGQGAAGYVAAALAIAADDSHGYSMARRAMNPDVDCSSLVYYSLIRSGWTTEQLGGYPFTTHTMGPLLEGAGFAGLPFEGMAALAPGDILVAPGHTEIYLGEGRNVGAHDDYDGRPGDSSGAEVCAGPYWDSGWDRVYRLAS